MSPLYPCNEWSDINVYNTIGKSMMEGKIPYVDIFDHKGPLIFLIYGLGYLISSTSFIGLYFIQLAGWCTCLFAIYFLSKMFINRKFSFCIALLFPFSALDFMHTGGSAEEFILLFMILSLYLFISFWVKQEKKHNPIFMLIHGLVCGIVLLIKLNLLLFWFFPLLIIFLQLIINKQYKNFFNNVLAYIIGLCVICIPIIIYFGINDALDDMYFVYIVLNKKYAGTSNFHLLIYRGSEILIEIIRNNLLWFCVISTGVFYFPYKYLKNIFAGISLSLSGILLIGMVFYSSSYQFYYPLVLYAFVPLGLICIFDLIQNVINLRYSRTVVYLCTIFVLFISVYKHKTYELLKSSYLTNEYLEAPHFQFKSTILEVKEPTLLSITFGRGCALFTTCNITPNVKYFITPNISYDLYPEIRDKQTEYIKNKTIDFIVSSSIGLNRAYFDTLPELKINYNKIDSVLEGTTTYFLYKKIDTTH